MASRSHRQTGMISSQAALNRLADAARMRRAARWLFCIFLILLPSTFRWTLIHRPVGALFPEFTSLLLYLSDTPLFLCLILWLSAHALAPAGRLRPTPWAATLPVIGLVALMGLSALWASFPALALESCLRGIALLGLALFVRNELKHPAPAAAALAVGAVIQSAVALGQLLAQQPLGLEALGELQDAGVRAGMGLWIRGYGLTTHPNLLGGYLVGGFLAALGLVAATNGWRRLLGRAAAILIAIGLAAAFSRSAWIGMVTALVALGLLVRRSRATSGAGQALVTTAALAALVAVGVIASRPGGFAQRVIAPATAAIQGGEIAPMEQISLSSRARQLQIAWREVQRAPLTGLGAANAPIVTWLDTPESEHERVWLPVHSVPLLVLEELGLPGLALWLASVIAPFALTWRRMRNRSASLWELVWLAALAALAVIGLVDYYPWGSAEGRALWMATWGLWLAASTQDGI